MTSDFEVTLKPAGYSICQNGIEGKTENHISSDLFFFIK